MNKKNIKFLVTLLIGLTCTQALHGQTIGSLSAPSVPPQATFDASQPAPLPPTPPPYVPPTPIVPLVPTPPPVVPPAPTTVPTPMPPAPPSTPNPIQVETPNNTAQPTK